MSKTIRIEIETQTCVTEFVQYVLGQLTGLDSCELTHIDFLSSCPSLDGMARIRFRGELLCVLEEELPSVLDALSGIYGLTYKVG